MTQKKSEDSEIDTEKEVQIEGEKKSNLSKNPFKIKSYPIIPNLSSSYTTYLSSNKSFTSYSISKKVSFV